MHTAKKVPSPGNRGLPPGCALPQLKSLFMNEATRGAGKMLYEILGIVELMRVAYEKGELESLQHRLALLLADAADLSAALSNILELSRLKTETTEPDLREFDIAALLQEVAQSARTFTGQKPMTIMDAALAGPVVVRSDPHKVRQIMTELMNNAIKFTERGRIALILARDEDSLRLMVTDTGKGMNPEEIADFIHTDDHEFDGEARPESRGLGLRIVRHLIRSLGGTLSVSSKIGEGTIVEVTLPAVHAIPRNTVSLYPLVQQNVS